MTVTDLIQTLSFEATFHALYSSNIATTISEPAVDIVIVETDPYADLIFQHITEAVNLSTCSPYMSRPVMNMQTRTCTSRRTMFKVVTKDTDLSGIRIGRLHVSAGCMTGDGPTQNVLNAWLRAERPTTFSEI